MNTAPLIWALWIIAGGPVNSGSLWQPSPVAYFSTLEGCERAKAAIAETFPMHHIRDVRVARPMRCIQADYVQPKEVK